MIRLVTYSDERMSKSKELCWQSAMKYGCHNFDSYWPFNIDLDFTVKNEDVLSQDRGSGYWLWKPYVIDQAMQNCKEDDVLIYSDAGVEFVNDVKHITSKMDQDIFFFTNGFNQMDWCKMDVIKHVAPDTKPDDKQVQASVIFFQVNNKTRAFVKEWLELAQIPGFIDDSPSKEPNHPTFAEHRHDQSILTALQYKYGYKLHWWPTQYSEHIRIAGDNYPVMFNHHRKRQQEW